MFLRDQTANLPTPPVRPIRNIFRVSSSPTRTGAACARRPLHSLILLTVSDVNGLAGGQSSGAASDRSRCQRSRGQGAKRSTLPRGLEGARLLTEDRLRKSTLG